MDPREAVQLLSVKERRLETMRCGALADPVPRVRLNAAHALACVVCKPNYDGDVPPEAVAKLVTMAASDPNAKVRREAGLALAARGQGRRR